MVQPPIQKYPGFIGAAHNPSPTARKAKGWRYRFMERYGMGLYTPAFKGEMLVPDWLIGKSVAAFFVALIACQIAYGHTPALDLVSVACLSVLLFFYLCANLSRSWERRPEKQFLKNVFWVGVIIRLIWVSYVYFVFNPIYYNTNYGSASDAGWYIDYADSIAYWFRDESNMSFSEIFQIYGGSIDDVGYPIWLSILFVLNGGEITIYLPLVVKSFMGAYCAICIYNIAKRHFGVGAARIAALFIMANPNMIYWCGVMMKEAEMVFLCCLCMDLVDRTFTSGHQLTFKGLLPGLLVGFSLFFFRAALGLVMFLAMFTHIVVASNRVMSYGKKVIAGFLLAIVLLIGMGDSLVTKTEKMINTVQNNEQFQTRNSQWRSRREGGNSFARYVGTAVFAPLIFTIPFPTFNEALSSQISQVQLSGGNYIRNVLSFFVIFVMLLMLFSGEWRKHVFIIAYTCGYLSTLALSAYAHSGRFHMPIWPMLMLFAAYGIQLSKKNARLRNGYAIVLGVEVVACLAWNWFKLKGRGMI